MDSYPFRGNVEYWLINLCVSVNLHFCKWASKWAVQLYILLLFCNTIFMHQMGNMPKIGNHDDNDEELDDDNS